MRQLPVTKDHRSFSPYWFASYYKTQLAALRRDLIRAIARRVLARSPNSSMKGPDSIS